MAANYSVKQSSKSKTSTGLITSNEYPHEPLVKIEGLSKLFPLTTGIFQRATSFIHAVDGININIQEGESLGLVGESGSGKTTTGKLLVRLHEPTEGSIRMVLDGEDKDIAHLRGRDSKFFHRHAQMIFQDPYESLNPRRTIFDTIAEPLAVQGLGSITEREERVAHILDTVGLSPPETFVFRYPHELSGGQRQRVAIARALIVLPTFIVADEPTSMLDVSIRTGVMNLMLELADEMGVTYLYITHDLAVARYMTQRLGVMYLGKIVEMSNTEEVLANPLHPYTNALLAAVPVPDPTWSRKQPDIVGSIAKAIDPIPRCRFYSRCPIRQKVCEENDHPPLEEKAPDHWAACYVV
jgi:peptide/nickel transport system ATP-binding protein